MTWTCLEQRHQKWRRSIYHWTELKSTAPNVDHYRIYYTSQTEDTSSDERWKSTDTCVKEHQRIHDNLNSPTAFGWNQFLYSTEPFLHTIMPTFLFTSYLVLLKTARLHYTVSCGSESEIENFLWCLNIFLWSVPIVFRFRAYFRSVWIGLTLWNRKLKKCINLMSGCGPTSPLTKCSSRAV